MSRWWVILALLVGLAACRPAVPPPDSAVWFLEVAREGGYWLGPDDLSRMGLDPRADSPPVLSLSAGGQEIPVLPLETADGWGIFFFAPHRPTRYAAYTALRLEKGRGGARMACEGTGGGVASAPAGGGLFSLHLEEDLRYLPQAEAEIPWMWASLSAPGALTFTLRLTDAVPGPVSATLHFWSHTAFPAEPDHHLRLWWDGRPVGEWEWDGMGMKSLPAAWEEATPAGEHRLVVEALLPEGVSASVGWLDRIDLTYRRAVRPTGDIWQAEGEGLQIQDAGPGDVLLDVTDPLRPRGPCPLPADGRVTTRPGGRYWFGDPRRAPAPAVIRPARLLTEDLPDVEYLVVAPGAFHTALAPLLEHRRAQGLRVGMVDPLVLYDTFGDGRPDPEAIRRFADRFPSLRYLLLVGDGTAGPAGDPSGLTIPPPMARTAILGETPADGLLGMDPTGRVKFAVGRLPARSPRETETMVEKILRWEDEGGAVAALIVHDDGPEFRSLAQEIQENRPSGLPAEVVDRRERALERLEGGRVWLTYVGHGSLTVLAKEGIFRPEDGAAWRGPVLVVAWTCLAAYFVHPQQESIAEVWLRSPGGAVAVLGPVGETTTDQQRPFALAFYRALAERPRLGDAWRDALQTEGSRDVALGYVLLGDPALMVGR